MDKIDNLTLGIITTITGLVIGFLSNYFIAKFNARNELKKSIAEKRAEYYIELWQLCDIDIRTVRKQKERFDKLRKWYSSGGGLLLSFKATDRLVGALNLLEESFDQRLNEEQIEELKENLSWLRTEMKYEVGSYSRKEAEKKLPNIKILKEKEEEEKEKQEAKKTEDK